MLIDIVEQIGRNRDRIGAALTEIRSHAVADNDLAGWLLQSIGLRDQQLLTLLQNQTVDPGILSDVVQRARRAVLESDIPLSIRRRSLRLRPTNP